jgi:ABC-2 type transport system permease protein
MSEQAGAQPRPTPVARGWQSTLRGIYVVWWRDLLRYWRDKWRLAASLAQPLLFLLVFGSGLSSALRGGFGGAAADIDYVQYIFPGVIAMAVLFTSIFSAASIVWDREFGFLRELLVAPIDRSTLAVGKALGGATQATIQGFIMVALAPVVGVTLTPLVFVTILPLIFVLAFSLSAMGVAIASRMRSMQAFQVVLNFLMLPIFFLSGALFPLTGLPDWMTVLTRLDPASYGVDPLRRVLLGASGTPEAVIQQLGLTINGQPLPLLGEVAILLGFGLLMLALAVRSFQHQE